MGTNLLRCTTRGHGRRIQTTQRSVGPVVSTCHGSNTPGATSGTTNTGFRSATILRGKTLRLVTSFVFICTCRTVPVMSCASPTLSNVFRSLKPRLILPAPSIQPMARECVTISTPGCFTFLMAGAICSAQDRRPRATPVWNMIRVGPRSTSIATATRSIIRPAA